MEQFMAGSFVEWLRIEWDKGHGAVGKKEELANALFPAWNPTRIETFL